MDNNISENKPIEEIKKEEPEKVREITTPDAVFAWFSYIASYLFCLVFPVSKTPFGGMLFIAVLFIFTFIFLKIKGHKLPATSALAGLSAVALSSSLIISSNSFIHFFAYVYCLGAFCYFIYTAMGNTNKKGFSNFIIADWAEAIFVLPFSSLRKPRMYHAMFSGKNKESLNIIKKLGIGLGIAVVPATIAFALLSYDDRFTNLMGNIFRFDEIDIFTHIFCLLFAIPLGMFMFSLYLSSSDKKVSGKFSEEKMGNLAQKTGIAPLITIIAAAVPLLAIYVLFFVSQWQYYVSAFTGVLPENFSYAEYAREGFFQLCAVSVINLIIIALVILFTKKSKASTVVLKILAVIFSLFTLVLISTAIAKLIMYIAIYGLTQKRFYAAWFMLVLALIFIAVAVSRFVPKISILTVSAAILVVSFTGLALCNADRMIAKHNVDRYINGTLSVVDVSAMEKLGDAATPELIRLANYLDSEKGTDILKNVKKENFVIDEDYFDDYFWEYNSKEDIEFEYLYGELYTGDDLSSLLTNALIMKKSEMEKAEDNIFAFTFNQRKAETAMKASKIIK